MIYTVKFADKAESKLIVSYAGLKKTYGTVTAVARELGVDTIELNHRLTKKAGIVFVIKRDGKHWYA